VTRQTYEEYRASGALATLEDDWIAEISSNPTDIDWFLSIAQALAAAGEEERARSLVELYDSELESQKLWATRLELLRRGGTLAVKHTKLQREVQATLEALWGDRPSFRAMFEHVGLHKNIDQTTKLWDRAARLQSLLVYEVGEVVAMAGQGVGRIAEVNLPLENLKIDFEKSTGVTVGFRAAAKLLKILPPGHLLRRKLEDPEGLARLRDEDPSGLLRSVLETADKPLTAGEIRESLSGIVSESQWTSWWAAARKHPQVTASSGGRQAYRWETSAAGALASVRTAFSRAEPRARMEIFRKNADRDGELTREMAGDLASIAAEAAESEPGLAFEIWFLLERSGHLPDRLAGEIEDLVGAATDARRLLGGIEDRLMRERALGMLRERREDWPAIFRDQFLRETEPKVLATLADSLAASDRAGFERMVDDLLAQPRRAPSAFVWVAERAADDEALRTRAPLKLLQQILLALATEEFASFRVRLRPLADSGGTVPRLLQHLDEAAAASALESVRRATALEAYQKDALSNALELRFPALRGESGAGPLYSTPEAIQAKRAELKHLTEKEIPANRKAIEEARAMGDLRENFEYKSARERHEYLNSRVAVLHRDLARARPIDFKAIDASEVRIGTRIHLVAKDGRERHLALLGPWDSRPEDGILSYESDLARALLGRGLGETVAIGDTSFRIESILPFRTA
jgi:transcription elongation GreA/GreB family factor